jgi:ABC-type lipoprotein export system ATPase subunit
MLPVASGAVHVEGRLVLVDRMWTAMGGDTPVDQVALPLLACGRSVGPARAIAMRALMEYGDGDWLGLQLDALGEGARERLAVIRAVVAAPDVLLVDEPRGCDMDLLRAAASNGAAVLATTPEMGPMRVADQLWSWTGGTLQPVESGAQVISLPRGRANAGA